VIKYIGSKRLLLPRIVRTIQSVPDVRHVLDLFSGTSRVGHALKAAGYVVTANDHTAYAYTLARCYVQADGESLRPEAQRLLCELNSLAGRPGYFTETFCVRARYLQPHNGERVDAIREHIATLGLPPDLEAVALVSLMEAADRVDSTCGLQMAYLKNWSARSHQPLSLRVPDMLAGHGRALMLDAKVAASSGSFDLAYLDPPYNQHRYLGNYHVWESLVRWDKPEVYGLAMKRVDCRDYQSDFNSKRRIHAAFAELVDNIDARYLLVSFSDEGYLTREDICALLESHGEVASIAVDYRRYVGAQIGIHNPAGERVGTVSHLRNREYLFLAGPEARRHLGVAERAMTAVATAVTNAQPADR
jgi:adenine-specific DNA-methyltransferase